MGLISQSIKNLKGGISQQPDILRFSDQGSKQVNAYSSEVDGLQKKPPTVHISRLGAKNAYGSKPYIHTINRDETEQYQVVFTGSSIKVINVLTGALVPVTASANALAYITSSKPRDAFRMVTVADYTFIINREKVVSKSTQVTPSGAGLKRRASVQVKGGQYGRMYRIWISGVLLCQYKTPLGDQAAHADAIDTRAIMNSLKANFDTRGLSEWSCAVQAGGYMEFARTSDMTAMKLEDGYNGTLVTGCINDVQDSSDLPKQTFANHIVKVSGDATTGNDDYWVMFDNDTSIWNEVAKPYIDAGLQPVVMPHTLIRQANGTFVLQQADWDLRSAGDDDTNPFPSFIGGQLADIFFFRNRLGLLSGENVILSESGNYWNFFPKSVAAISDSDPIDVAVSINRVSILKYAVPFSEELLLWSDNAQFVLSSDGTLTASSATLDVTTEFEITDKARPFGIGRGVYFVAPRAQYSSVRRYYAVADVTQVRNAEDMTAHLPSYIPNGVFKMNGSSTENFLTVLTEGAPSRVYFYKFLYLQEQLAQQSWSYWDFGEGCNILSCEMFGSKMFVLIDAPSGVYLERIEFTQNTKDFDDEPFRLYFDRKKLYTIPSTAFNQDTYITKIKLKDVYGAAPIYGDYYLAAPTDTTSANLNAHGLMLRYDMPTGGWGTEGIIEIDGDWAGTKVYIGEAYEMLYEFSKFLIKQTDTKGGVSTEDIGRLQLRRAWVNYENSGAFKITVNNNGNEFTYNMTGGRVSTNGAILGDASIATGQFRYSVGGDAKTIIATLTSDTPNAVSIIGGGWEGNYVRRSSGI